MDGTPVKSLDIVATEDDDALDRLLPRQVKVVVEEVSATNGVANGNSKSKRPATEMTDIGSPLAKRPKIKPGTESSSTGEASKPVEVEDDGAILIDD